MHDRFLIFNGFITKRDVYLSNFGEESRSKRQKLKVKVESS